MKALKSLAAEYPGGRFWIKGDATDVVPSLTESKTREWNGDVDYGDGAVQRVSSLRKIMINFDYSIYFLQQINMQS